MNEPPFYYLDSVRLNHKNENELLDGPRIHGPKVGGGPAKFLKRRTKVDHGSKKNSNADRGSLGWALIDL